MFEIFNSNGLGQKERFWRALIIGSCASLVLLVIYLIIIKIMDTLGWEFAIAYMAVGYAIGWVIQKYGRGVKVSFSIMAAVFCVLIIFFGDLLSLPWQYISADFFGCLRLIFAYYLTPSINTLLSLAFRVFAVIVAYNTARVV